MVKSIKSHRDKAGLTQEQLAKELSVTQQAIAKWETGDSLPRADKLIKLAEILDCTVEELLVETKTA